MAKSQIEKRFRFIRRLVNKLLAHAGWQHVEFLDDIIWRCQRFWRGYADIDVWSIDSWMSEIMPRMLDQFLDELHGYPSQIKLPKPSLASLPTNVMSDSAEDGDTRRFEQWKSIVREIKDGFVAWKEMQDANIYSDEEAKPYIRRFRRGMLLMTRWFNHLWD